MCAAGQLLTLMAYRTSAFLNACLIGSRTVAVSARSGMLDDLPLTEGETFNVATIGACADKPLCPTCWDTRQVRATAGGQVELSLKPAASCSLGDPTLALVFALPRQCSD